MTKPFYRIYYTDSGNFEFQWERCFQQLADCLSLGWKPFRINIFIHCRDIQDFNLRREFIRKSFMNREPATVLPFAVIPQSPVPDTEVMMEAGFISPGTAEIVYYRSGELNYAVISSDGAREAWITGISSGRMEDFSFSAVEAFEYLRGWLNHEKSGFNQIVRQWNYIGEILKCTGNHDDYQQNYQMFNETRNRYYSAYRTHSSFPAATGIGMSSPGVMIDCFALQSDNTQIIPVRNPNQTDSYHYRQDILAGGDLRGKKQPPQFERALLLNAEDGSRLLISGTASIVGEDTMGTDVESQTIKTIQNMEALASPENLMNHCPHLKYFPEKYNYLRVYVKRREEMEKVRQICSIHFDKDIPVSYVQADICRDNLLVEIEGEKIPG